jgi:hypothetical protein
MMPSSVVTEDGTVQAYLSYKKVFRLAARE